MREGKPDAFIQELHMLGGDLFRQRRVFDGEELHDRGL
jgi:hypothetical protein